MKYFAVIGFLLVACLLDGVFGFASTRPTFSKKTSSSLQMTVLSYNGKKKNFKAGPPLSKAVQQIVVDSFDC